MGRGFQDQNEDPLESEGMRKMFIGGINRETALDSINEHFSKFGTIVDSVIIKDHDNCSRGFGFVTYERSAEVEVAFQSRPHIIDDKELDIKRAIPRDLPPNAHQKIKKLFVGGVAPGFTPEEFEKYIQERHPAEYGTMTKIDFMKGQDGQNKGFGFVECSSQEFADRLTICEQQFFINGKKMGIKKAEPKPESKGPTLSRDGMQLSLKKTLETPDALDKFMEFAKKDLSEENLVFWLEVKNFKSRWDATTDLAGRGKDAKWMIEQFLQEGSPQQVCIGDTRVKEVLDAVGEDYTREMFDLPEDIAYGTLKFDIFSRFDESEEGMKLFKERDDLIEKIPSRVSVTGSSFEKDK